MRPTALAGGRTPDDVCNDYQPLIEGTIRQLRIPGQLHEDAAQEGAIGLLAAVVRYDTASPVAFGVFARAYVRGAIIRRIYTRVQTTETPHEQPLTLEPLVRDLADFEGEMVTSLHLALWLATLAPADAWIVQRLYWQDAEVSTIATELGVSPRRVNQRHRALLADGAVVMAV